MNRTPDLVSGNPESAKFRVSGSPSSMSGSPAPRSKTDDGRWNRSDWFVDGRTVGSFGAGGPDKWSGGPPVKRGKPFGRKLLLSVATESGTSGGPPREGGA